MIAVPPPAPMRFLTLGTSPPEADQPLAENFRHLRHFRTLRRRRNVLIFVITAANELAQEGFLRDT